MRNRLASLAGAEVRIGISKRALTIVRCGAFGRNASVLHEARYAEDTPMEVFGKHCRTALSEQGCAGLPLSITLGDELVRLFMVTPPQNAARMQDLIGAASMRFHSLFGETPRDWRIEADWRVNLPFLACALPSDMVAQCAGLARDLGMPLAGLQPHFISAWNLARNELAHKAEPAWLAVFQGTQLSLGMAAPGANRVFATRGLTVPVEQPGRDWLQEQVTRAALQTGLAVPSRLLLAGEARSEWTDGKQGTFAVVRFEKETMPGTRQLSPRAVPQAAAKAAST
jgi:hypothetical protein